MTKAVEIKWYVNWMTQFNQNGLFRIIRGAILKKTWREDQERWCRRPDGEESRNFWVAHRADRCLKWKSWMAENVKEEVKRVEKQREIVITIDSMIKQLRKLSNLKAPGPDSLHSYWLKYMSTVWGMIAVSRQLQSILQSHNMPKLLVTGSTSLIIKDKTIGAKVRNFRPISWLPLMWKFCTGILS